MKIAVFTDLYLGVTGGIPSSIRAQKADLEKQGHQVVIFCPGYQTEEPEVVLVPTYTKIKIEKAVIAKTLRTVKPFVKRKMLELGPFDLVHVHYEGTCSLAGAKVARELKLPLIQTMHGREDVAVSLNLPIGTRTAVASGLNFLHYRALKSGLEVQKDEDFAKTRASLEMWSLMVRQANFADLVITPTEHFGKKLKKYGVIKPVVAISNGVMDSLVDGLKINLRKWQNGEKLKMLWHSRLSKEKRILELIRALARLNQLGKEFEMMVYGEGNQSKTAKRLVDKLGLTEKVIFKGKACQKELFEAMKNSHLDFTVSYGFDTQGMTLLEAQAVGLPVFYCDPDMDEVVPNGGGIRSGKTSEQMAERLLQLYENPEEIEQMSRVMMKRRHEVLQSEQTKKLIKVYQTTLEL